MKTYVCRLTLNQDLLLEINQIVRDKQISAGAVLTCVGSLSRARLRLAGGAEVVERDGPFEITSLVGTLSADGVHLHIALFDGKGTGWVFGMRSKYLKTLSLETLLVAKSSIKNIIV